MGVEGVDSLGRLEEGMVTPTLGRRGCVAEDGLEVVRGGGGREAPF